MILYMKRLRDLPLSSSMLRSCRSTIGDYASYQAAVFQEGLREEKASRGDMEDSRLEELRRGRRPPTTLQEATCPDITAVRYLRAQLTELLKLPAWARVVSAGNMLSHIGYPISGTNTVGLHMKVPCSRLGATQDCVNFSSVNINVGPGDCEWFAVPHEYWGQLLALCERQGVDFVNDTWWPNMKDLNDEDIPVYRFLQRPGDMVWVNAGCVYWVQSGGWCNSIKWNVAPLSSYQYQMAVHKWRWNVLQFARCPVPLVHLSWNLARNIKMTEEGLFIEVKKFIFDSLVQFLLTREHLLHLDIKPSKQLRRYSDPAHYCQGCEAEIFGYIFVEEESDDGKARDVTCFHCAKLKTSTLKGLICIEEQSAEELAGVFDGFRLHASQTSPHASFAGNSAFAAAAAAAAAAAGMSFPNSALQFL